MHTTLPQKRFSNHALALLALSLGMGAPLHAAVNARIIPADSQWLVHLDLEAMRRSELGMQLIFGEPFVENLAAMELPAPFADMRLDIPKILETIGSITAYGKDLSGQVDQLDGALILEGTAELRTIVEGMLALGSTSEPEMFAERTDLPFEAYSIQGDLVVGLPGEPIVIVSKSPGQVIRALEAYRGSVPTMASQPSKLTQLVPDPGHFFVIAASVVPSTSALFSENAPQARILQLTQAASVSLGERDTITHVQLRLNAASSDMATKLERIVLGMTALISLVESSDQALTEFLNSVTVVRTLDVVQLDLAYPAERILQMVKHLQDNSGGSQGEQDHASPPAPSAGSDDMGVIVSEWVGDKDLPGGAPDIRNLTTHRVDRVSLRSGATITIAGRRGGGELARVDYVEIVPSDGLEPAKRYEAEFMRRTGYRVEAVTFASGGEGIMVEDGRGTAQFEFLDSTGIYDIIVGYLDESDGKASFALGVKDPGVD